MIERKYTIKSYDVYPSGEVKPSAVMKYMQQAAREDCDEQGCTYVFMRAHNIVFVLVKLGLEFYRPIKTDEVLTVKTFNNSIDGVTFDREYEFFVEGEKVAHASTYWILIRFDDRTIVRPKQFEFAFFSHHLDCDHVGIPRGFSTGNLMDAGQRKVKVSDLDENDHLNNCVYADISFDLSKTFDGLNKSVKTVKLIFRHEARLGDVLNLSAAEDDKKLIVSAQNLSSEKPCFECEIEFQ